MEKSKHLLILVNGYTGQFDPFFPNFCAPLYPYWTEKGEQFLEAAKAYFGGVDRIEFVSGDNHFYSSAKMRKRAGFNYGMKSEANFRADQISILGHSMGCAFAEGIAMALHQLGKKLVKIVHFAAADARGILLSEDMKQIPRVQLSLTHDYTLRISDMLTRPKKRMIKGVHRYGIVRFEVDKLHKTARKKERIKWNSHFDTKAYGFVFDFLRDLERLDFLPVEEEKSSSQQTIDFLAVFSIFSPLRQVRLRNKVNTPFVFVQEGTQRYYGILEKDKQQAWNKLTVFQRIVFWWKRLKY